MTPTPPQERANTAEVAEVLEDRYQVTRRDGRDAPGRKHHGCRYFVLDLTHDSKAAALVAAYFDMLAAASLLRQDPPQVAGEDPQATGKAIYEALADRLGEHPKAYNVQDHTDEYTTAIRLNEDVEVLAEWLTPAVLAALPARPQPEDVERVARVEAPFGEGWLPQHLGKVVSDLASRPEAERPRLTGERAQVMGGPYWLVPSESADLGIAWAGLQDLTDKWEREADEQTADEAFGIAEGLRIAINDLRAALSARPVQGHWCEYENDVCAIGDQGPHRGRRPVQAPGTDDGLPCDGGCSVETGGPSEECSRHGRPVREVWDALRLVQERERAALARAEAAEGRERALLDLALGRVRHVYAGLCPDDVEGWESRDPECPACVLLDGALSGQPVAQEGEGWTVRTLVKAFNDYAAENSPCYDPKPTLNPRDARLLLAVLANGVPVETGGEGR